MNNVAWTDAEIEILQRGVDAGVPNEEIQRSLLAQGFDRTPQAIRQKRADLGMPNETESRITARLVSDREEFQVYTADVDPEDPIEEVLEQAISKTRRAVERAATLSYAHVKILTKKPIGVCFVSDQHIAQDGPVDMERMFRDAETIQRTPGLYAVLGGDGIDNHIKHRRALLTNSSKPSEEWRLYNHYLSIMGRKTLAMIAGNHDAWSVQFAGIDMVFELAQKQKIHYSPDELVLTLELVPDAESAGQQYVAKVRHKARYGSSFNLGHTVKRMYDMGGDPFDVGVVCHHHEAALEIFNKHGLPRIAFRPGSYQVASDYSSAEGFNRAYPTCPTVILWPGERVMLPFHDLGLAAQVLALLREAAN